MEYNSVALFHSAVIQYQVVHIRIYATYCLHRLQILQRTILSGRLHTDCHCVFKCVICLHKAWKISVQHGMAHNNFMDYPLSIELICENVLFILFA